MSTLPVEIFGELWICRVIRDLVTDVAGMLLNSFRPVLYLLRYLASSGSVVSSGDLITSVAGALLNSFRTDVYGTC